MSDAAIGDIKTRLAGVELLEGAVEGVAFTTDGWVFGFWRGGKAYGGFDCAGNPRGDYYAEHERLREVAFYGHEVIFAFRKTAEGRGFILPNSVQVLT